MASYQRLSEDQLRAIATAYYEKRQSKALENEQPVHMLVGGQPGAGKSQAGFLARSELSIRNGFVHVDADRMRERLPLGNSQASSAETQPDAGQLVAELRKLATAGKRNIVEEGTFREPSGAERFIKGRQQQGYKVEMLAVATPREESLAGIYQRFEDQHAQGANLPRFVDDKYHDEAMQGFEMTLVKASAMLDRVRVIDRSGQVLYDSQAQQNKQANALEALLAAQKLSTEKLAAVSQTWAKIESMALQRNAPADYLEAVNGHARRLENMQKEPIRGHAMNQLDTNVANRQSLEPFVVRRTVKEDPTQLSSSEQAVLENSRVFLKSKGFSPQLSDAIIKELDAKLRLERPLKNRDGGEHGKLPALRVYDLKADRPTPPSRVKDSPEKPQDQAPAIKSLGRER